MQTLTHQEQELEDRITEGRCQNCGDDLTYEKGEYAIYNPSDTYGVSYVCSFAMVCKSCGYEEESEQDLPDTYDDVGPYYSSPC